MNIKENCIKRALIKELKIKSKRIRQSILLIEIFIKDFEIQITYKLLPLLRYYKERVFIHNLWNVLYNMYQV